MSTLKIRKKDNNSKKQMKYVPVCMHYVCEFIGSMDD